MKENNETPKIQKIDVNPKTGEPVIVKLAEKEVKDLSKDESSLSLRSLLFSQRRVYVVCLRTEL